MRDDSSLRVHAAIVRGPSSAVLRPAGVLPGGPTRPGGLAVDDGAFGAGPVIGGGVLATIGLTSVRSRAPELQIYRAGPTGFASAPAPAVYSFAPTDDVFHLVAARGVVAVSAVSEPEAVPGACPVSVFTAGPDSFSGALTPAACLLAGDPVAASPSVIVTSTGSALDVYVEPPDGWMGSVSPSAVLSDPANGDLESVTMSGATIAACTQGRGTSLVDVFSRPAGGWRGSLRPRARLRVPGGAAAATLSGRELIVLGDGTAIDAPQTTVRDPVFVLHRAVTGWPATRVSPPRAWVQAAPGQADTDYGLQPATLLGSTTAFTNISTCSDQGYPPCDESVYAINGLNSPTTAPAKLPVAPAITTADTADGTPVASDGTTLALGAQGVHLYTIAHTPPARLVRATLRGSTSSSGLSTLILSAVAGRGNPGLASVRVLLPSALGGGNHAHTITLPQPARRATLTLRRLHPTRSLQGALTRVEEHGTDVHLVIPVEMLDTTGRSSETQLTITVSREAAKTVGAYASSSGRAQSSDR